MSEDVLTFLRSEKIRDIFRDNHIPKAYLIGSFSVGKATLESDIDIMYIRPKNRVFTLMNL